MVYTKEQQAAYNKAYRAKNKERVAEQMKAYKANNKERIAAKKKAYRAKNTETIAAYKKDHNQTPTGIKSRKKCDWKRQGIIYDLNKLHHIYSGTNKCWVCKNKFKSPRDKQADHDHNITTRDNFRYILCQSCNNKDYFKKHLAANIIIRFFNQM